MEKEEIEEISKKNKKGVEDKGEWECLEWK